MQWYPTTLAFTGQSQPMSRACPPVSRALPGHRASRITRSAIPIALLLTAHSAARADEGGVSFWLPGQYASFAAAAPTPGFALPTQTYYYGGNVGANIALDRGNQLSLGIDTDFLGQFFVPTWAPDTKILGAQPSFSLAFYPGWNKTSADITLGTQSVRQTDEVTGFGDLYPTAQLFWSNGVNNWMAYVTGDIPVGNYNPDRLANLGLGHAAIDFGGAYTYLNPKTGWEFSATAGLTFNFENPDTKQTSGTDAHLDLGTARFLNEQLFVGLVGFAYVQLSADKGQPAALGDFKSQSFAVGPQLGYNFNAGGVAIYTNLRGYIEFDTQNRTQGGSIFLTINIPVSDLMKRPK